MLIFLLLFVFIPPVQIHHRRNFCTQHKEETWDNITHQVTTLERCVCGYMQLCMQRVGLLHEHNSWRGIRCHLMIPARIFVRNISGAQYFLRIHVSRLINTQHYSNMSLGYSYFQSNTADLTPTLPMILCFQNVYLIVLFHFSQGYNFKTINFDSHRFPMISSLNWSKWSEFTTENTELIHIP